MLRNFLLILLTINTLLNISGENITKSGYFMFQLQHTYNLCKDNNIEIMSRTSQLLCLFIKYLSKPRKISHMQY